MRFVHAPLAVACLLVGARSGPACGEDRPQNDRATAPLELRLYPVRSLLRGHPRFQADRGPFPAAVDEVNSESRPLFGSESDDREFDFETPLGFLESVREESVEPSAGDRDAASIALVAGDGGGAESLLAVGGPQDLQTRVATWLSRAARDVLPTVVLDVAAFRGAAGEARAPGGVPAAVARGTWVPLGAVRLTMHPAGHAAGRSGALRAYLRDHDVEVAIDASTSVPLVGVAPEGLAVEASSVPGPGESVSVRVRGWWASAVRFTERSTAPGDHVEVPDVEGTSFEGTVVAGGGAWSILPGGGPVVLAARARVEAVPPARGPADGVLLSAVGAAPATGPLASRTYPVSDLTRPVESARGWIAMLPPSEYVPPEPPPLEEATPPITVDTLADLLGVALWRGTWDRAGAALDVTERRCRVVTDEPRHAQVATVLARLRETRLRPTSVRARVVEVPWAALPEWWTGLPEGLVADGGVALLARAGARVVEDQSLLVLDGQRRATVEGGLRNYVAGYTTKIATLAVIGNPIVRSLLEGTCLDVECDPVFAAPAASLALRLDAGRFVERREVPTCFGAIECPTLHLGRSRGEATVPIGATRVVAAWGTAGGIRLVLLTASRE